MEARQRAVRRARSLLRTLAEYFNSSSNSRRERLCKGATEAVGDIDALLWPDNYNLCPDVLGDLLLLADALVSFAALTAAEGPGSPAYQPPAGHAGGHLAGMWMVQLTSASNLAGKLMLSALNHCANGLQQARVLHAAAAVSLLAGGAACQRLAAEPGNSHVQPMRATGSGSTDSIATYLTSLAECIGAQLNVMRTGVEVAVCIEEQVMATAAGQATAALLNPQAVLPWLRQVLQALEALRARTDAAALEPSLYAGALTNLLATCTSTKVPALRQALCSDAPLVAQAARLTAASHADMMVWAGWGGSKWRSSHKAIATWCGSWLELPWGGGGGEVRQLPLPLLLAAGSMLQAAEQKLRSLDTSVIEGDGHAAATECLADWWQHCISILSSSACTLLAPAAASGAASAARARKVFLAVAGAAPRIADYFGGSGALGAGGGGTPPLALSVPASDMGAPLASVFRTWAASCKAVASLCPYASGASASTAEQQQEVATAAVGLTLSLVRLLPLLPTLVHALNGGVHSNGAVSGDGSATAGCGCALCSGQADCVRLPGLSVLSAAAAAIRTPLPGMGSAALVASVDQLTQLHTECCQLAHAVLALSHPERRGLCLAPQAGPGSGKLSDTAAAALAGLALQGHALLRNVLARIALLAGGDGGAELAALSWNRHHACCLLEVTAATAATLAQAASRDGTTARQRTLHALHSLSGPAGSGREPADSSGLGQAASDRGSSSGEGSSSKAGVCDDCSSSSSAQTTTGAPGSTISQGSIAGGSDSRRAVLSDWDVLVELADGPDHPASAPLLAPLLHRLLPPPDLVEQQQQGGGGVSSVSPPAVVPVEAEVLQAHALARRRCSYLQCSSPAASSSSRSMPRGRKCSRCMVVRYCSTACQHADWRVHKVACRVLTNAAV